VDSDFLKPVGMVTGYRRVPADDHIERKNISIGKACVAEAFELRAFSVNNVRGALFTETFVYNKQMLMR